MKAGARVSSFLGETLVGDCPSRVPKYILASGMAMSTTVSSGLGFTREQVVPLAVPSTHGRCANSQLESGAIFSFFCDGSHSTVHSKGVSATYPEHRVWAKFEMEE